MVGMSREVGGAWDLVWKLFCCMQNNITKQTKKIASAFNATNESLVFFLVCFTTELLQCNEIEKTNKMLLLTLL